MRLQLLGDSDTGSGGRLSRCLPWGGAGWIARTCRLGLWFAAIWSFLAPHLGAQALAMRHFDHRDGLPQSQVFALLEDRHGSIWAGTGDGLVRLGPNGAQLFDATSGLHLKEIHSLLEDREGAIWAGSPERGLARIRGREVVQFGTQEGLQDTEILSLIETRQGDLLAGSHQGLFRRRGERFELVPLPEPWRSASIDALAEDAEGWLWVSSKKGALLARWNGSQLEDVHLPPEVRTDPIIQLQMDPAGQLWALQAQRLLKRTRDRVWEVEPLPGLPAVVVMRGLAIDRNGDLVLGLTSDGLFLRSHEGVGRVLNARDLLCRDSINCAFRDRNGGLWIGTDGDYLWGQPLAGLLNLSRHPRTGADLGLGTILSFLELPGNRMLMGGNNGVFLWEGGKGLVQRWNRGDGPVSEDVWALSADGQDGAWVGTTKGLYRLGSGGRLLPGPRELQASHVESLVRVDDRLWVGTDLGLAELDARGRFLALHDPRAEMGYSAIHCLLPREGELLVGTSLGLRAFRNGSFPLAYPGSPADHMQVLAIHEDANQRLWVGTSQGLLVREPRGGAWKAPGLEAGGQALYGITWIRSLVGGALAIGHAKGVTLVGAEGKSFHLTRRLGLISDETNQGGAQVDHEGRLWIGMVGGACILERQPGFPVLAPPTPVILDVAWERGSFWFPKEVTLPPGFTSLTVHVDAGPPNTPFPVRLEARLDDSAGPWHPLEPGLGSLSYGGMSHGTHRLWFRASFDGTTWRESTPLVLALQPPWYLTRWAKGLLLLLAILGGFAAIKARFRFLERNNRDLEARIQARTRELEGRTQELAQQNQSMEWIHRELKDTLESRMRMINTVSHDLRSPLTSILLSVDLLQDYASDVQPQVAKTLGVMAQEARRLEAILKAVLDRNRADSMAERLSLRPGQAGQVLENLEGTLALRAESLGLKCHLDIDPASLEARILLDPAGMQQVLFNLVENALKFTVPPGGVGVRSSMGASDWVLEVWDTGRGMTRTECDRLFHPFRQGRELDALKGWGLGLYICRTIVEAHGGRIEVESKVGSGSTFKVILPLAESQEPSHATSALAAVSPDPRP